MLFRGRIEAAFSQRTALWVGFGLYWSLTKGFMNAEVFSFPEGGTEAGVLPFFLFLLISALAAFVTSILPGVRERIRSIPAWVFALTTSVALLLLLAESAAPLWVAGCILCALGMTGFFLMWFALFFGQNTRTALIDVPIGFAVGNVLAWLYTLVGAHLASYLFFLGLFLSAFAGERVGGGRPKESVSSTSVESTLRLGVLKGSFVSLLSFFSISVISITVSYIALFERQVPIDAQVWIHLVAPTLGALLAIALRRTFSAKVNAAQVVIPLTATMLLPLPLLGSAYVVVFKFFAMVVVEFLFVQAATIAVISSRTHEVHPYIMGGIVQAVISFSTLAGALAGFFCEQVLWDDAALFGYLGTLFAYLLVLALVLFLVPLLRNGKRGAGEEGGEASKGGLTEEVSMRCKALATEHRLTPREQEVLAFLVMGRSAAYIAEELCLSTETVKGHTRHIYRKLQIHSKQELLDRFQECDAAIS